MKKLFLQIDKKVPLERRHVETVHGAGAPAGERLGRAVPFGDHGLQRLVVGRDAVMSIRRRRRATAALGLSELGLEVFDLAFVGSVRVGLAGQPESDGGG